MHQAHKQAQGSPARPQGIPRSQQPPPPSSPPPSRMQPAEQPFRPTRILTHANSGMLQHLFLPSVMVINSFSYSICCCSLLVLFDNVCVYNKAVANQVAHQLGNIRFLAVVFW